MIIFAFVMIAIAAFAVGYRISDSYGGSARDAARWHKLFRDAENRVFAREHEWIAALRKQRQNLHADHAEVLKDAVELERYLKDEEVDELAEEIWIARAQADKTWNRFWGLWEALHKRGARLDTIRKQLADGDL